MTNEEKHGKGEGNNLPNTVMISPQGVVVFQGKYADKPIIKEENGMRRVFTSDGKLIMEVPLDELERDDEWFAAFKDPDEGDIEVLPTKYIATEELYIPHVLEVVLEGYALPIDGHHGVDHWARVLENGLRLARETGANVEVVALFAVLHDSQRLNEMTDPEHGPRAAKFATKIRGTVFNLLDHEFELLFQACHGHTHERTHPDVTVQTCWDSDRLDLGRVGVTPHPSRLCTNVAKRPEMIKWADGRASFRIVPSFVRDEWGIELTQR